MIKKLIAAGTLLLFSIPAIAGDYGNESIESSVQKVRFGVYVAPTLSWMRPTTSKSNNNEFESENAGSKVGFTYGLMMDYNFAENYAFVTGIQVNMTGGKISTVRAGSPTTNASAVNAADFTYRFNYVEIPLALKMRTDPFSGFRFFGQAGITPGINIAKKADYEVAYIDANGVSSLATEENVILKGFNSPVLLQMNIGVGLEYPISNKLAGYLGVFFNNGFAPDATNPDDYKLNYSGSFKDGNTRLNNFALRFGLYF